MMAWMALLVALLLAGAAGAQTIPMPFADDIEAQQVSVVVTAGRTNMRGLTPDLVAARRAMHAGAPVPDADLRALADRGDGLAAQRFARRLIARGEAASRASDLAYYAAIAVGTGRVWTLPDMVEAMRLLDPANEPRERLQTYIKVLYAHAWAGNTLALDAVVDFNGEGRLFGALSEKTRQRILAQGQANEDGKIELRLAVAILEQAPVAEEKRLEARKLLDRAAQSAHLGVRTTAETMIRLMDGKGASGG